MGQKIQIFAYTYLHCYAWVQKINEMATHSSSVMHESKNSNFWLDIRPL